MARARCPEEKWSLILVGSESYTVLGDFHSRERYILASDLHRENSDDTTTTGSPAGELAIYADGVDRAR